MSNFSHLSLLVKFSLCSKARNIPSNMATETDKWHAWNHQSLLDYDVYLPESLYDVILHNHCLSLEIGFDSSTMAQTQDWVGSSLVALFVLLKKKRELKMDWDWLLWIHVLAQPWNTKSVAIVHWSDTGYPDKWKWFIFWIIFIYYIYNEMWFLCESCSFVEVMFSLYIFPVFF